MAAGLSYGKHKLEPSISGFTYFDRQSTYPRCSFLIGWKLEVPKVTFWAHLIGASSCLGDTARGKRTLACAIHSERR